MITKHGRPAAVIVPVEAARTLLKGGPSVVCIPPDD